MSLSNPVASNSVLSLDVMLVRGCVRVSKNLLSLKDALAILGELHVGVSHLGKQLFDLSH